jgi:hypothetical protein
MCTHFVDKHTPQMHMNENEVFTDNLCASAHTHPEYETDLMGREKCVAPLGQNVVSVMMVVERGEWKVY